MENASPHFEGDLPPIQAAVPAPAAPTTQAAASPYYTRYRTGFVSDQHLGARGASAGKFIEFLRVSEFDKLYVVGDLIDIWQLRRGGKWTQDCNDALRKLLGKASHGTPIIYIPGNHDDYMMTFLGA